MQPYPTGIASPSLDPIPAERVLFTINSLNKVKGGPPRSVTVLADDVVEAGGYAHVLARDMPHLGAIVVPQRADYSLVPCRSLLGGRILWSPAYGSKVREICREHAIEILHEQGTWQAINWATARMAERLGLPRIVTPRAQLVPWSLKHKPWRKYLAWAVYQRRDINRAACIHVTAESEARHLRTLGVTRPIAIIPIAADIPPLADLPPRPMAPATDSASGPRIAMYLGRLHPSKGLLELVAAWGRIRPANWKLLLVGPDYDGHLAVLKPAIIAADLAETIEISDPAYDAEKWALLRACDLFVLPSHGESFGLSVAEAFAAELPVIATTTTPWECIGREGVGFVAAPEVDSLADALAIATATPLDELRRMGERGRVWLAENFDRSRLAGQMFELYHWVRFGGAPPDCLWDG